MSTVKKTLSVLLACVLLLTVLPAFSALAAGELIEGTHVRWSYNSDTKTLTFSGYGPMPDYLLPELPPVPAVPWLEAEREAEPLVINNGITVIGDCCFMILPALTRAVLPESLIRIGSYNFFGCKNLSEVNLPSGLLSIGEESFEFGRLTSVEIPAGVKSLRFCFNYMFLLTDVTLHDGLESIDNSFEITALQSLTVPSSVVSVTGCSFVGLKTLVNRSAVAIVHEQMDSFIDPADTELRQVAMARQYDMYIDYYFTVFEGTFSEEEAEAYMEEAYVELLEQMRLWLNENRGTALQTPEETEAYLEGCFKLTGAPAADAEICCVSGSAEDKALDKTSIPHYLIDRDNALCDRPPEWSGAAGENITWAVDGATGTLTFTGCGETDANLRSAGYHRLDDIITSVAFECTEGPITHIGDGAFEGLVNLTALTLPDGLRSMGEDIIRNSGVRVLTLPGTLGDYYPYALRLGNTPLQRIELSGESERYFTEHGALYAYGIYGVEGPTLCKLPAEAAGFPLNDSVVQFHYYAIDGLAELTTFTVPGTVKDIYSDAFYNLPALETVILEPGDEELRRWFTADDFGGGTKVPSFVVSEDDERFFARDGVLYDKTLMRVLIVPGDRTSLDLAEDIKSIYNYILDWNEAFEQITVRGEDFDFFTDNWHDSRMHYIDENTLIVCHRGTNAESYALRFGCRLEYLEDITVTDIDIIADGPFVAYRNENFTFRDLSVHALVNYSDGETRIFPARDLFYTMDDYYYDFSGNSSHTFYELTEQNITVKFGSVSETFTLSVLPSPVTYRFDLSEAYTDFEVWEEIGPQSLNAKLFGYDPRTGVESEISIYNASLYCWDGADWTNSCWFSEPGSYRLKLEYRGFTQEFTVNVRADEYLFTTNADEAVTEVPQFAVYTKAYGGNRLFVTHNGQKTDITDQLTVCAGKRMQNIYNYDFEYPDTTVPGETAVWLCAYHYDYRYDGSRSRAFRVMMPLEITVVPGEVTDAYLDVSDVPEFVPAGVYLTAGDLGIKLVKTMADGSVQIDENPALVFHWNYDPGLYAGDSLHTGGDRAVHYVRVNYGSIMAKFTVRVHKHAMTFVPADAGDNCRCTGCIEHWHCTSCGKNYAEEAAVTEIENVSDGVYGPHTPYGERVGFAPTCTEEGLVPYYVCLVCGNLTDADGNLLADPTLPAGHDYGEWIPETAPSCTAPGIKGHYTCTLCGGNFDENKASLADLSIAAVPHTPGSAVRENVAAATCTAAGGYDEVVYCVYCPAELSRNHVATATTGHSWGEWQVIKQATTSEEGLMRRVCNNDASHVEEEVIPKLQPQTSAFQRFIERIREFFQNIIDWFSKLFRF